MNQEMKRIKACAAISVPASILAEVLAATSLMVILMLYAAPAKAATRVETMNNSCASVQRTLIQNGAAILRYPSKRNPSLTLYDRYVGDSRFCASNERGVWASVPAKNTNSCRVIACERYEPDAFFPFNRNDGLYLRLRLSN